MIRRHVKPTLRHAKNYGFKLAQDRLNETLPIVQQTVSNSVQVNSAKVMYFARSVFGMGCSCRQKSNHHRVQDVHRVQQDQTQSFVESMDILAKSEKAGSQGSSQTTWDTSTLKDGKFAIKHMDILRGDQGTVKTDQMFPQGEHDHNLITDALYVMGDAIDCGVCYRTGYVPGYSLVGSQTSVHTAFTKSFIDLHGYYIDTTKTPEVLTKIMDDRDHPYVAVRCKIPDPDLITRFLYTVRENKKVLTNVFLLDHSLNPITNKEQLKACVRLQRNRCTGLDEYVFTFLVNVDRFSHIAVYPITHYDLYANISDESTSLDYRTLDTLSNLTLTFPPLLPKVTMGDLIIIPPRNLALKVMDSTRKNTVDFKSWEYTVNARQLQPSESLINLALLEEIPML